MGVAGVESAGGAKIAEPGGEEDAAWAVLVAGGFLKLQMLYSSLVILCQNGILWCSEFRKSVVVMYQLVLTE